jgi:tetratricopeptide (TPR) repeat protein
MKDEPSRSDSSFILHPFFRRSQAVSAARKRGAVAAVCLCVIGGAGYLSIYPHAAAFYYGRRAEKASAERALAAARADLERVAALLPGSAEKRFALARACRRAGDLEAARQHLEEARRLGWDRQRLNLEDLLLRAQAGMVRQVEAALKQRLAASDSDAKLILEALVLGCLEMQSPGEAYRWAALWLEHDPDDWQAYYWRGVALETGQRQDLAAEDYQQVLERKPGFADARLRLADVLAFKGQFQEALPQYQEYLAQLPGRPKALLGLARCRRALGAGAGARQALDELLAAEPKHAGALLLRGQLEIDADHAEEALRWLRRAQEQAPHDMDANQALAAALRLLGREDEARIYDDRRQQIRKDLKRLEEINKEAIARPQDAALRYEAGTIATRLGQGQAAARWLVSAFLLDPADRKTRQALEDCLRQLGDPQLLEKYRRLLADRPAP